MVSDCLAILSVFVFVMIGDYLVDWRFYSLDMLPVSNTRGSKYGSRVGFRVGVDDLGDWDKKRSLEESGCRNPEFMQISRGSRWVMARSS
jgi:hypothetical protein